MTEPIVIADAIVYSNRQRRDQKTVSAALDALFERMDELVKKLDHSDKFVQNQLVAIAQNKKPVIGPVILAESITYRGENREVKTINAALDALFAEVTALKSNSERTSHLIQSRSLAPQDNRRQPPIVMLAEAITYRDDSKNGLRDVGSALSWAIREIQALHLLTERSQKLTQEQLVATRQRTMEVRTRPALVFAAGITFSDRSGMGLVTVQDALRWLIDESLKQARGDDESSRVLAAQTQILFDYMQNTKRLMDGQDQKLLEFAISLAQKSKPITIASTSNPALKFDANGHIHFDLDQAGSFDDSVAALGVNTLQQAVESVAQMASVSVFPGNQLEALPDGLFVPELQITTMPALQAVSSDKGVLNLSPAVIAHRRGQIVANNDWQIVDELPERVWDTLSNIGLAMAALSESAITVRRDGYYLVEAVARGSANASIVLNGEILGVDRLRDVLRVDDRIGIAVRADQEYTAQVDLFVQLIA